MLSRSRKACKIGVLFVVVLEACVSGVPLRAAESGGGRTGLLISLDAAGLADGPLGSWENAGSLKGVFRDDGTRPQVKVVDGVKAVVFSGRDHMTAEVKAPSTIVGDKPWTCIIRVRSDNIRSERAVVAWANRPGNCLEIEYGDAPKYGAVGTWNDPHTMGWGDEVPPVGRWHILAYVYHGGKDGDLQAWCDGQLRSSKKVTLATKAGHRFVLGACPEGDDPNPRYVHGFQGALASVRVYEWAFSPVEIWNASGFQSAYPVAPARGAVIENVSTTLAWAAGNPSVASYDVYVGADQCGVEKADSTLPVGKAEDWQKVYKGNQAHGPKPQYGPLPLDVGKTYYWRIDQRDAAGKLLQRGVVAKFTTDAAEAKDPAPADGYIMVEGGKKELRWKPGKYAIKQNFYIGATREEVVAKKTPDIAGLPSGVTAASLPIANAVLGKTYCWRVESVNRGGLSVTPGTVWNFRAVGRKVKVYLVGGQSNAVGCASVNGLPERLRGPQRGAIIFVRGECRVGPYGWASLKDGLGSWFGDYDGRGTFGPELAFGAAMAPQNPEQVMAIIKCAWGGTNLGVQWRPPSAGGQTGELYTNFVKAVREGLAAMAPAFEPEISGMIWMQGESDSGDQKMTADYAKNLKYLIQDLRTELKSPKMPFVFAQISKAPAWDQPPGRGPQIRAAQLEVSRSVPHTATFATDDYKMCDPWHYDTAGTVSLGERFAEAMKNLEKSGQGSSKAAPGDRATLVPRPDVTALVAASSQRVAADSAPRRLGNARLNVRVSGTGELLYVENRLAGETYSFASDGFALDTDLGTLASDAGKPALVSVAKDRLVFQYRFSSLGARGTDPVDVELSYTLGADNSFFRRSLKIANSAPLRLKNVRLGRTAFQRPADETIHYLTFWMAPTVEFIRFPRGGMFTGIENPFYRAELDEKGVALSFEPGMILKAGEGYQSEPQFIGVYKKSGVMIEDSGRPFRYPNGSGHIPIDRTESRAMRAYALDYLAPAQKGFLNINYQFFHPLPQMPRGDADKLYFTKAIDTFADIGGNMIIFNPLHPYTKPDAGRAYWNVLPDDPNATARQIADYAANKGISYGFYMGCAAHGGEGNAAGLPFRPDKPQWKKMDAAGRRAPDNCIACDEFFQWWLQVQDNTINRYNLSNWSWDPSRGSGMNCYDETHGHIAGRGAYKGWRRCMELGRRLKESNPGLFIQAFYGTKQFGLWGLKDVNGHEVYNEQTACVSTHHTQISDDRQNADGLRFQNYWSMRFRFLPTVMGHPLVGRMSEGPWDRELVKACDHYGWQYSLMSALAVSGSIMPAILPYESDLLPGYKEFYRKWTAWANANFEYVQYTEPFGEQVQPGAVDGYARIKGDHGFVFLFNGNPRPSRITFEIGDEINLQEPGDYELVELYPTDGAIVLDNRGKSVFALGQSATVTVPANACKLLELRRVAKTAGPVLAGIVGRVAVAGDRLKITSVRGKPGQSCPLRVRLTNPEAVGTVRVNGVELPFSRAVGEIKLNVQFAGDAYVREMDRWIRPDGGVFRFPNAERQDFVEISTKFRLNRDVPQLLERARPKNFAEMDGKIAAWQASGGGPSPYHNFTCCRPGRLWLVIPFTLQRVGEVKLWINAKDCSALLKRDGNGHSFYADVTDLAAYGADNEIKLSLRNMEPNEFMGPLLMYPDEALTGEIAAAPRPAAEPVVFTGSLAPLPPPRYVKGAKRPVIAEAVATRNVTLNQPAQIRVKVDLAPEKIREVKYSESGLPWMSQGNMGYNDELKCWLADLRPGPRAAIQENEYAYVWAIGSDGLWSDFCPVKVDWDFCVEAADPTGLQVGHMLANKLLVLGNSITLTKRDAPQGPWQFDGGASASAPDKDFAHLLARDIAGLNANRAPALKADNFWYLGAYEQSYDKYDIEKNLKKYLDWGPDILVVAIGENVPHLDTPAKQAAFAKSFKAVLDAFKKQSNPAIFVRGQFMAPNPVHDRIMKRCCEEAGGIFVSMDTPALSGDPRNYAAAEKQTTGYTNGAILAHPGDRGMKAIADALFEAMEVRGGLKKPGPSTTAKAAIGGGTDKTLVSWVALSDTTQRGGSALTIQRGEEFDAIVFGENEPGRWMAGSNHFVRTQGDQRANAVEKADNMALVQMAIVYKGSQISIYRNGEPYASYQANNIDLLGLKDNMAVFGLRHRGAETSPTLVGSIEEARVYDRALTADEIRRLVPNKPSEIKPYAWWTFEKGRETDAMGRFPFNSLGGGARVEGGRLVLPSDGATLIAAAKPIKIVGDVPSKPALLYQAAGMYHWDTWFLPLGEKVHMYHLQVKRPGSRRPVADHEAIGHAILRDLLHWQEQPVALRKGPPGAYDDGCLFTAYAVEHQGVVYLYYCSNHHEKGRGRQAICLATSKDGGRTYEKHPGNPIIEPDPKRYYAISEPPPPFGHHAHPHIDCRDLAVVKDPTGNGWLGYVVMRRKGQKDAFHSACVALCRSNDLVHWEVGDPCCTPNRFNCFEVPDVFQIDGKWYMIALPCLEAEGSIRTVTTKLAKGDRR